MPPAGRECARASMLASEMRVCEPAPAELGTSAFVSRSARCDWIDGIGCHSCALVCGVARRGAAWRGAARRGMDLVAMDGEVALQRAEVEPVHVKLPCEAERAKCIIIIKMYYYY